MFQKLKEWWLKERTYREALNKARYEERLKNVEKEAKIDEHNRLMRKKMSVKNTTTSFIKPKINPKKSDKMFSMDMEI